MTSQIRMHCETETMINCWMRKRMRMMTVSCSATQMLTLRAMSWQMMTRMMIVNCWR
jgi:hypothetical protein